METANHNIFAVPMAVFLSWRGKEVSVNNGVLLHMAIPIVLIS